MSFDPEETKEEIQTQSVPEDQDTEPHDIAEDEEEGEEFDSSLSSLSDDDLDDDPSLDAMGLVMGMSLSELKHQQAAMRQLLAMMRQARAQSPALPPLTDEERALLESPLPQPLETPDLAGVAKYIMDGHAKNIIVMSFAPAQSSPRAERKSDVMNNAMCV